MASCAQPGCSGSLQDGYCDVCGMAASSVAKPAGQTKSKGSARTASGRTASGRSAGSRGSRSGSTGSSRRGSLGLGLVEVPPVPYRDPSLAVLSDPKVAETRRFCSSCSEPAGRPRNGNPARTEGFCPSCGTRFSFSPKLAAGDLVAGQYEVLGCLAHGGLGWIYLARDKNVSDRWVVLKGLLDSEDTEAMAAAVAERRFLATVEHPNIVRIYNFVQHDGSGYIVMEYVGGRSLKEIVLEHRSATGRSLPLTQVIAYGLESLRALGYLHSLGLVYCDFKPDNVIQTEEQLKLIDLGGVRPLDEDDGPIYGTVGYQAPEIAEYGPSVASDLYTVARSMAVMAFEFTGYTGALKHDLPERVRIPVLAGNESFDRLLRRATDPDPERRFWSAEEMAAQLTGVLREVLAASDGKPRPGLSTVFGPELRPLITETGPTPASAVTALPVPLVTPGDPAAAFLAGLASADPMQLVTLLSTAPVSSPEVELCRVRAHLALGDVEQARRLLSEADNALTGDWRVDWHLGLTALAAGDLPWARRVFDDLYGLLPGEAAPRLAFALTCEFQGDLKEAAAHYEAVWRTGQSHVSAGFGLARAHQAAGDLNAAVQVLDSVPAGSGCRPEAQVAAVAARVRNRTPADITVDELIEAGRRLESLGLDGERAAPLAIGVHGPALAWVPASPAVTGTVLGVELTETGLRFGLERAYRRLARLATHPGQRIALVDRANALRPRTFR